MCENLPAGEFYDDIVIVKFCQEELDRQIFEADPPQWFLDTTHALQILNRRLEEGTHYFD
jgi:hypothetical protein